MNLGVFGGTFDPPHVGHLVLAQDVLDALGLDAILFVPAASPPHKRDRAISPAADRLRMLKLAVGDDPRFEIDELELHRDGPSYTVDTLRALRDRRPDAQLHLILGMDQFRELAFWREPEAIASLARLVVLPRAGMEAGPDAPPHRTPPVRRVDVSGTEIRRRVASGRSIRYLVPDAVMEYIQRERLYLGAHASADDASVVGPTD